MDKCKEIKKDGQACNRKTKYGDKCGYHNPKGFHKKQSHPPQNLKITELTNQISQLKIDLEKSNKKMSTKLDKISRELQRQYTYDELD